MNILILSWRGPGHPNAGGAEISTHEHAKRWVQAGHKVYLFTSYYKGAKKEEITDGVKIIRIGRQNFGVHLEAFKWYCFKQHPEFNLVIDQFHGIPFFTPLYVKVKKIGFIHEVTKDVWRLNQYPVPFNIIVYLLGITCESFIFRLYKKIPFITVSESTKMDLIEWGIPSNNITVIYNGVRESFKRVVAKKDQKKTLIYLGALAKDKGVEDALQVFSILASKFRDLKFWVVGKSAPLYLERLKVLAKELYLDGKIKFWGFVSEEKKFKLLSKAHILINPSIREGWGLVVIEAASVGTPTVAFDVPGLRDSIISGKTGILCVDRSDQSMSKEILELLQDDKMYVRLSKGAILWSKNFSWDKAAKESLKLLNNILNTVS